MPFGRKKSLMDRAHDYVEQISETVTDTVVLEPPGASVYVKVSGVPAELQ